MSRCMIALFLLAVVASFGAPLSAEEEILVIEQDYNIVETGNKEGPSARDVRQKIYISSEFVCIDEFGGKAGELTLAEVIMIDLKNKQIININPQARKKVTESFEDRRKRIESRKKTAESDLAAQPDGPQKEKMEKLYRALLDDRRKFAVAKEVPPGKTLANVPCRPVKIVDADKPEYAPLEAQLHSQLELPYDNTEVLYLLQLIGRKMADFLRVHKETFKYVPMELHLDLAAGGSLDTKVVSVTKVEKSKLDFTSRGTMGNPFMVPENLEERKIRRPPPKQETPDDKPN